MHIPRLVVSIAFSIVLLAGSKIANGDQGAEKYVATKNAISVKQEAFSAAWRDTSNRAAIRTEVADFIIDSVNDLSTQWLNTRWGRGIPQLGAPGEGKINCGTFVGTILNHAGFRVNIKKLQRQPSQMIIRSFVSKANTRKMIGKTMKEFISSVREMGPGLFIIGLDFHVGLLLQTESELRFIHSSIVPGWVVNQDAATAGIIKNSRYKIVGKLLGKSNVTSWLRQTRIVVRGKK